MKLITNSTHKHSSRIVLFFAVMIVVFFARSIYTTQPEMHDARKKWVVANSIAETNDLTELLSIDHHSSRWALILPTALAIKISGKNLITYFGLVLLLYSLVFTMLLSFAQKDINPKLLGVFAVLLFYEPMFFRASTQLQPFVFGLFYLLTALWAMVRYIERRQLLYILLSAVMAFLAYGTKESYLFFVAGLVWLLFWKTNIRATIIYCITLLILFGLETWIFNALSGNLRFGRIEFLMGGKHQSKMPGRETYGLLGYFTHRWELLTAYNKLVTSFAAGFLIFLVWSKRLESLHPLTLGIILMGISYAVLLTLLPMSLNPLIPLQPQKVKYLTPLMPFIMFIVVLAINFGINCLTGTRRNFSLVAVNLIALMFLIYSIIYESPFKYKFKFTEHPTKAAMLWGYGDLNESLLSGYGVCEQKFKSLVRIKNTIRNYMNENNIVDQLAVSKMGNVRVLHHRNFEVEDLIGFIPHKELNKIITKDQCQR